MAEVTREKKQFVISNKFHFHVKRLSSLVIITIEQHTDCTSKKLNTFTNIIAEEGAQLLSTFIGTNSKKTQKINRT